MHTDATLHALLTEQIATREINVIIETGTHLGTGSTRFLADLVGDTMDRFVSIEVNHTFWRQARVNLADTPVECLWGRSVTLAEGLATISSDPILHDPNATSPIYIDTLIDPIGFYQSEIANTQHDMDAEWAGDDLLRGLLTKHGHDTPLIVLDSAGGIGRLEFEIVLSHAPAKYLLLLDDVRHVKHYRSLEYLISHPEFVVWQSNSNWALAWRE